MARCQAGGWLTGWLVGWLARCRTVSDFVISHGFHESFQISTSVYEFRYLQHFFVDHLTQTVFVVVVVCFVLFWGEGGYRLPLFSYRPLGSSQSDWQGTLAER